MTEQDFSVEESIALRKINPDANKFFELIETMASSIYQSKKDIERAEKSYLTALKVARKLIASSND